MAAPISPVRLYRSKYDTTPAPRVTPATPVAPRRMYRSKYDAPAPLAPMEPVATPPAPVPVAPPPPMPTRTPVQFGGNVALDQWVPDSIRSLAKGAIGIGEGLVGLGDAAYALSPGNIGARVASAMGFGEAPTGSPGQVLEDYAGYRPQEAKEIIASYDSPELKAARARVDAADGFLPTIEASLQNPSTIVQSAIESAPSMLGSAGLARGAIKLAPKLSPVLASAFGEGAVAGGQSAESIRQQTGTMTPEQAAIAVASGGVTAAISRIAGKAAERLKLADPDTLLAGMPSVADRNIAARVIGGMMTEGFLEELPQSAQEQLLQNAASGKPLMEGVQEAAAAGFLTGAAMGGAANLPGPIRGQKTPPPADGAPLDSEGLAAATQNLPALDPNAPDDFAAMLAGAPAQPPTASAAPAAPAAPVAPPRAPIRPSVNPQLAQIVLDAEAQGRNAAEALERAGVPKKDVKAELARIRDVMPKPPIAKGFEGIDRKEDLKATKRAVEQFREDEARAKAEFETAAASFDQDPLARTRVGTPEETEAYLAEAQRTVEEANATALEATARSEAQKNLENQAYAPILAKTDAVRSEAQRNLEDQAYRPLLEGVAKLQSEAQANLEDQFYADLLKKSGDAAVVTALKAEGLSTSQAVKRKNAIKAKSDAQDSGQKPEKPRPLGSDNPSAVGGEVVMPVQDRDAEGVVPPRGVAQAAEVVSEAPRPAERVDPVFGAEQGSPTEDARAGVRVRDVKGLVDGLPAPVSATEVLVSDKPGTSEDRGDVHAESVPDSAVAAYRQEIDARVRQIKQAEPNLPNRVIAQRVNKEFSTDNRLGKGREALGRRIVDEVLKGQENPKTADLGNYPGGPVAAMVNSRKDTGPQNDPERALNDRTEQDERTATAFDAAEKRLRERFGAPEAAPDPEADLEARLRESVAQNAPRDARRGGIERQPPVFGEDQGGRGEGVEALAGTKPRGEGDAGDSMKGRQDANLEGPDVGRVTPVADQTSQSTKSLPPNFTPDEKRIVEQDEAALAAVLRATSVNAKRGGRRNIIDAIPLFYKWDLIKDGGEANLDTWPEALAKKAREGGRNEPNKVVWSGGKVGRGTPRTVFGGRKRDKDIGNRNLEDVIPTLIEEGWLDEGATITDLRDALMMERAHPDPLHPYNQPKGGLTEAQEKALSVIEEIGSATGLANGQIRTAILSKRMTPNKRRVQEALRKIDPNQGHAFIESGGRLEAPETPKQREIKAFMEILRSVNPQGASDYGDTYREETPRILQMFWDAGIAAGAPMGGDARVQVMRHNGNTLVKSGAAFARVGEDGKIDVAAPQGSTVGGARIMAVVAEAIIAGRVNGFEVNAMTDDALRFIAGVMMREKISSGDLFNIKSMVDAFDILRAKRSANGKAERNIPPRDEGGSPGPAEAVSEGEGGPGRGVGPDGSGGRDGDVGPRGGAAFGADVDRGAGAGDELADEPSFLKAQTAPKSGPAQKALNVEKTQGGDQMLLPGGVAFGSNVERKRTEGREAQGPLFQQEAEAEKKADAARQKNIGEAEVPADDDKPKRAAADRKGRIGDGSGQNALTRFLDTFDTPQTAGAARASLATTITFSNGTRGALSDHIAREFKDGARVVLTKTGAAFVHPNMRGWDGKQIGRYGMQFANWLQTQEKTEPKSEAVRSQVKAKDLQPGDFLPGSNSTVISVARKFVPKDETQKGKVEVSLREANGKTRVAYWNPSTVIAVDRTKGPSFARKTSAESPRDLILQHNLTAANLIHADKMGGLAVPSMAVAKRDMPLEGFGEITLLGDKALADPQESGMQVFGGDIYSPRYPTIRYKIHKEKVIDDALKESNKAIGYSDWLDEMKKGGADALSSSNPNVVWTFLKSKGIEPDVKLSGPLAAREAEIRKIAGLEKFFGRPRYQFRDDPEFIRLAMEELRARRASLEKEERKVLDRIGLTDDQKRNVANRLSYELEDIGANKVDRGRTRDSLRDQLKERGLEREFETFRRDLFEKAGAQSRIFKGYTDSGRERLEEHTLENVVAILKKNMKAGEGFSYGPGTVRGAVAPRFKTLDAIRKAKGQLVSKADMEKVKEEVSNAFWEVANMIPGGDRFGHGDHVVQTMVDAAKMGIPRAVRENNLNASGEAQQAMAAFMDKLRTVPTEYFEAKLTRAVGIDEFKVAVVPNDTDPKAIAILEKNGLKIERYDKNDPADRRRAIKAASEQEGIAFARRQGAAPAFFSALERAAEQMKQPMMAHDAARFLLDPKRGAKAAEAKWTGLDDFLGVAMKDGKLSVVDPAKARRKVTPEEVREFLKANAVTVTEVSKSDSEVPKKELDARWNALWQPGGSVLGIPTTAKTGEHGYEVFDDKGQPFALAYAGTPEEAVEAAKRSGPTDFAKDGEAFRAEFEAIREASVKNAAGKTKFAEYQLPGGRNYREVLLTLPDAKARAVSAYEKRFKEISQKYGGIQGAALTRAWTQEEADELTDLAANADERSSFKSGHWQEPNILAHVRFNERTDSNGKRVLFLEEIQSDWAQQGRKRGFEAPSILTRVDSWMDLSEDQLKKLILWNDRNAETGGQSKEELRELAKYVWTDSVEADISGWNAADDARITKDWNENVIRQSRDTGAATPRAPFVEKTEDWTALALKSVLHYAAANGFDSVAWTPGSVQNERYDLSKQLDTIGYMRWEQNGEPVYNIRAGKGGSEVVRKTAIPENELEDVVGKEMAQKIVAGESTSTVKIRNSPMMDGPSDDYKVLSGLDLKVGGEGMKAFYDKIVPQVAEKIGKKFGARVRETELSPNQSDLEIVSTGQGHEVRLVDSGDTLKVFDDMAEARAFARNEVTGLSVQSIPITPEMRAGASEGFPLFNKSAALSEDVWNAYNGTTEATRDASYPEAIKKQTQILGAPRGVGIVDFEGDVDPKVIERMARTSAGLADRAIKAAAMLSRASGVAIRFGGFSPAGNFHGVNVAGKVYVNYLATHQMAVEKASELGIPYERAFAESMANVLVHESAHYAESGHGKAFAQEEARIVESMGPFTYSAMVRDFLKYAQDRRAEMARIYEQALPGWIEGEARGRKAVETDRRAAEDGGDSSGQPDGRAGPGLDGDQRSFAFARGDRSAGGLRDAGTASTEGLGEDADVRGTDGPVDQSALVAFARGVENRHGLERFDLLADGDDIVLAVMVTPKASRSQGRGTAAMKDLIAFADEKGKRIVVTPARRGDLEGVGPTSYRRTESFYERFGFVKNKGANRDETAEGEMYRKPVAADGRLSPGDPRRDENFKKWFAGSKVVDANGKPQIVYHGTEKDFTTFRPKTAFGWGEGIYFSDDAEDVDQFADGPGARVIPAYVKIENPFMGSINTDEIAGTKAWAKAKDSTSLDEIELFEEDGRFAGDVLRELGYDGVIANQSNSLGGREIVAFKPEQVKSATGNRGSFDPSNPDIRFSRKSPAPIRPIPDKKPKSKATQRLGGILKALPDTEEDLFKALYDRFAQDGDAPVTWEAMDKDALATLGVFTKARMEALKKKGIDFDAPGFRTAVRMVAEAQATNNSTRRTLDAAGMKPGSREYRAHIASSAKLAGWILAVNGEQQAAARAFAVADSAMAEKDNAESALETLFGEVGGLTRKQAADVVAISRTSPKDLPAVIGQAFKPGFFDWVNEWRKGAMLFSLRTYGVNFFGNAMKQGLSLAEIPLAAVADKAMNKGERQVYSGELGAAAAGLADYGRAAFRDFLTETGRALKGVETFDPEAQRPYEQRGPVIPGPIGKFIRTPFRMLQAADNFFKKTAEAQSLYREAFRRASNQGLKGDALWKRVDELISIGKESEWKDPRVAGMMARATKDKQYETFTLPANYENAGGFGALADFLGKFERKVPLLGPVAGLAVPFKNTPANIAYQSFERSPFGFFAARKQALDLRDLYQSLNAAKGDEKAGIQSQIDAKQRELSNQIARATIGTTLFLLGSALAAVGLLTGSGPPDWEKRKVWEEAGNLPNAVNLGGTWYGYDRFEPLAAALAIAGNIPIIWNTEGGLDKLAAFAAAMKDAWIAKTYFQGLEDFSDLLKDPARYGANFLRDLEGSFVPAFAGQTSEDFDPIVRDRKANPLAPITSKIPGMSQNLPAVHTGRGDFAKKTGRAGQGMIPAALNPFGAIRSKSAQGDPLAVEMVKAGYASKSHSSYLEIGVGPTGAKKKQRIELTENEREAFRKADHAVSERFRRVIGTPGWANLDPNEKLAAFRKSYDRASAQVRNAILPAAAARLRDRLRAEKNQ